MGHPRETPPQAVLEQARRGPVRPAAWGRHGARWLVEKSWGTSPAGLLEARPLGCQGCRAPELSTKPPQGIQERLLLGPALPGHSSAETLGEGPGEVLATVHGRA